MKTIGRILIILAAAMVIVGATLAILHTISPMQSVGSPLGGEEFSPGGDRLGHVDSGQALVSGQTPAGLDGGFRRGRNQIGGAPLISAHVIRNLAVIAGCVLVVTLFERVMKTRHPRRASKRPASQV